LKALLQSWGSGIGLPLRGDHLQPDRCELSAQIGDRGFKALQALLNIRHGDLKRKRPANWRALK
jgi:hypothetical protein